MAEPRMWPARLPDRPLKSDYSRGLANNTTRTDMEYGPAKTRRRTSAMPGQLNATYALQEKAVFEDLPEPVDQKALFERFYLEVAGDLSFWLPNPEKQTEYILVRIIPQSEQSGLSITPFAPGVWKATLSLEVHALVPAKPRS